MAAVWMRLRAELRGRWRAWLALALIFGIGSGIAIAALAGARRTDTAYPRFVEAQDGFDAVTGGGAEDGFEEAFAKLKAHPAAESADEVIIVGAQVTVPAKDGREELVFGFPDAFVVSNPSGRVLYETNRAKILEGRLPDKTDPHEIVIPFTVRDRFGLKAGDQVIVGIGFDESFGPVEQVPMRVVGVIAAPGDFEAVGQTLFVNIYGTPALIERYRPLLPEEPIPDLWNIGFHLRGGPEAAVAFKQAVEREFSIDVPAIEPVIRNGVQKTMRLYGVALWVVGSLIAVATVAIVGQALARQTTLDSSDGPTLRALGFSPGKLVGLSMLRSGLIGLAAAATAALVAYVASPFFPIGPARIAEPFPGFALDAFIVGLGAATVALLVPFISLIPAIRASRAVAEEGREEVRASRIARTVSTVFRAPATAAGIRMALEPGRGQTAVPVRSTILAVALGIAAVTGSLVVGDSLTNLIDDPTLAGFTYDALLPSECPVEPCTKEERERFDAERAAALRRFPFVDRLAKGTALNVVLGGADSFLLALEEGGDIGYALIEGRAPTDTPVRGLPQIALGQATMRRMDLSVGDTVDLSYPYHEPEGGGEEPPDRPELRVQRAGIVGVAAIPPLPFAATEPGEGAIMSVGGVGMFEPNHGAGCCFVAFDDGTNIAEAREALEEAGFEIFLRTERADLATLEQLSRLPIVLSLIFAIIGAAALTHVLVTAVRRRRRELAVLKTLGFLKGQVRGAVAWQVSAIALIAAVIGIPAGVAVGRWGWGLVAGHFAVVSVPVAPIVVLVLVLPAALLLANVVALLPARSAARTRPALVLRAE